MTILTDPEYCYCTMDEMLDGHRHHCPMHMKCSDCEPEEDLSWLDALVDKDE